MSSTRRTVRARLTLLYAGLFIASGGVLLALLNVGVRTSTRVVEKAVPVSPEIFPRVPAPTIFRPAPAVVQQGRDLRHFAIGSIIALVVMVLIAGLVGWWISGRVLRPVRTITAAAREISASNLHARLAVAGPRDEIRELGETLDELFARLEASFASTRHFVANASHELRTPLAAERAILQVALADPDATVEDLRVACGEVLGVNERQARLIDALLVLAGGERGVEHRETVDLARLVREVVEARRNDIEGRGLQLEVGAGDAEVGGDRSLLESLIANLVDNAARHNVEGGRVEVSTTTVAGRPTLIVRNTGPVIDGDQVAALFEPFRRLGQDRVGEGDGHGLGLAIVAAIADAHGATVDARARPAGGLDVDISFPA
jgi:signal transduction histidine kinase